MSDTASTAWDAGAHRGHCRNGKPPRRALEIFGIVVAFIWFWPVALAYLVWKIMGYPKFDEAKAFFQNSLGKNASDFFASRCAPSGFTSSTGNAAFEDYRKSELARLEEERRKLDEEAREFRGFVEELKRAKDREEFDAFMSKRRADRNNPTAV